MLRSSGERFCIAALPLHSLCLHFLGVTVTRRMPVLYHRTKTADDFLQTPGDLA